MKLTSLALLLTIACTAIAFAQDQSKDKDKDKDARLKAAYDRLDSYAERQMRDYGVPGMSLALTDRNGLLYTKTYGYADTKLRKPVAPDTKFEIGSISKSFTSICLLQLNEAGKFDPHQPITKYLPWFSIHSNYPPISGHDVLTHTAGLPRDRDDIPSSLYQAAGVRDRWTGYAPGKHFLYSNVGFQIMGYLLEEITGKPSYENVRARVLQPLGMAQTEPDFTHDTYSRLATGYSPLYDDRPFRRQSQLIEAPWLEYGAGDGAIVSTATDMATYLRMLLNRGQGPNGRIVSDSSFQLLTQKGAKESEDEEYWYGYGMSTWTEDGHHFLGHDGGMVGYSSEMKGDTDLGVGVIALVNWPDGPVGVPQYALRLLRAAYEGKALPPLPEEEPETHIKNAADYAGTYTAASGEQITLKAQNESLIVEGHARPFNLRRHGRDEFLADDPDFNLFPWHFGRQEGKVAEFYYGGDWYTGDNYKGPREFKTPPEWAEYPGHYRSNQSWTNNFRIVLRKGKLSLVVSDGDELAMTPDGSGSFWAGEEGVPPQEQVSCDTVVHGKTQRCTLSGQAYYRTFTP